MSGIFGSPLLEIGIYPSRKCDHAIFDRDANLIGLHLRVPFQLRQYIFLDFFIDPY